MYNEKIMKYEIEISDLEQDGNKPSIYLKALIEDIPNAPEVSNIKLMGNVISIETNLSEIELKNELKLFLVETFNTLNLLI